MPAKHHSSSPPTPRTPHTEATPASDPAPPVATAVGRIPVLDVRPLVQQGRYREGRHR